jgi:predicted ABC-type transport system involved in lysophospholipase L1 biosynthesis ATPase subunit
MAMNDETQSPDHVTIIKERGSGGSVVLAVLAALAIALVARFYLGDTKAANSADDNVAAAADKVGAAADKVGDAAQDAAKKVQ